MVMVEIRDLRQKN